MLLLEALIAMSLLLTCLGTVLRGPLLLVRLETKSWQDLALQWEIDRQFLILMSQVSAHGIEAIPAGEIPLMVPLDDGSLSPCTILWACEDVSINSEAAPMGSCFRLTARVRRAGQDKSFQRSLFVRHEP
jgi:hypothetical protein